MPVTFDEAKAIQEAMVGFVEILARSSHRQANGMKQLKQYRAYKDS